MRIRFSAPQPTEDEFLPRGWNDSFDPEEMRFRDRPVAFAPLYEKWVGAMRKAVDAEISAPPLNGMDRSIMASEAAIAYCLSYFYRLFARSTLLGDPEIEVSVGEDSVSIAICAPTSHAMTATEERLLSVSTSALSRMARCAEQGNFRFHYDRTKDRFGFVLTAAAVRKTTLTLSERVASIISRVVLLAIRNADSDLARR